jgi:hypothetical protein
LPWPFARRRRCLWCGVCTRCAARRGVRHPLLQTALAALTRPELLQPELAQTLPDSPFDSAPQLPTMAAMDEVSAAPDSDMPDMGQGCLPASLLSELVGAPPVATSASGAQEASFAAPSKPPGSGTCAVWAPPAPVWLWVQHRPSFDCPPDLRTFSTDFQICTCRYGDLYLNGPLMLSTL